MENTNRTRLLSNVEKLTTNPDQLSPADMVQILRDLGDAYSEYCNRKITFFVVCANVPGNKEQMENFEKTLTGTNHEHTA